MSQAITASPRWSMAKRIFFLFCTLYFIFLILDFTSSDEIFPHFIYVIFQPLTSFWNLMVPWTGENILHLSYPITVKPNGSGDTTYNYVLQLLWVFFALLIAVIWALADRRRTGYNDLYYWMRTILRYYLAMVMFSYGFYKVIKLQFPFPSLNVLTKTYGDSSPMGLAWNFIGYSKGYNYYTGGAEVIAGALLLFRKTSLFGALIAMTILMNIAAINFCYDIPVKLYSTNLILVSVFIASYHFERLKNFFFVNKTAAAASLNRQFNKRWHRITRILLKLGFVAFALHATWWLALQQSKQYGDEVAKPPLYGIYDIETYVKNGDTLAPLLTDSIRARRMLIDYPESVQFISMKDEMKWFRLELDTLKKTAIYYSPRDTSTRYVFSYQLPSPDYLIFQGGAPGDSLYMRMKKFDLQKFNLVSRGFNWVNEYPYNR